MMNESKNLSEDYKLGYKNGQQMLAQHLLRYELDLITGLPTFIKFIERIANPDVPEGLNVSKQPKILGFTPHSPWSPCVGEGCQHSSHKKQATTTPDEMP